jgi:hypothetical protein
MFIGQFSTVTDQYIELLAVNWIVRVQFLAGALEHSKWW